MKKIPLLIFAAILILPWVPAQAIEIIYPADGTFINRSDFLIIKAGTNPPLEGITIGIGGVKSDLIDISSPEYRAAFSDFIILQPEFDRGRNLIEIEGYAGKKKVVSAKAEIYFLAGDEQAPPPFRPSVLHLPEKEKLCASCHNLNPEAGGAKAKEGSPCAACHKRMLEKKYVHGPAGVWSCTYCHPGDTRPARYQAREGDAKVCNECHADKVKEYRRNKFVHGPVEAEMCSACHDPHATDHPAQLIAPINDLCLSCHSEITKGPHAVRGVGGKSHPLKGYPDPSRNGRQLACTGCHDPHGGAVSALFQRGISSRFVLCQMCHKK